MSSQELRLPHPIDWQVFEDLCADLWSKLWEDPNVQKHGRGGQAQQGIDIYGRPNRGTGWEGIQCKFIRPPRILIRREIEDVIAQARKFSPSLACLIIATTAPRDVTTQQVVRELDDAEHQAGSFAVKVVFWEDITSRLQSYPEIVEKYYPALRKSSIQELQKLEIAIRKDESLDFLSLVPAFSSIDVEKSDRTTFFASLSGIEIINHDNNPTEIERLWLSISDMHTGAELAPLVIKEEVLSGNPRIEARSRRRFDLKFTSVFDGSISQDGSKQVVLHVKAIGLGEYEVLLGSDFWYPIHGTDKALPPIKIETKQQAVGRPLRVFLCHSSGDKAAIRVIYKRLREDGFAPWVDEEDILPGQDWEVEIRKAVKNADIVAVFLSQGSITKAGYVQKEIRFALDVADTFPEGLIYIIPVKLEQCSVPESLSRWHWVSLFEEDGYNRLLRSLKARAGALGT